MALNGVAITGIGIVSSIGNNNKQCWDSLVSGATGIGPMSILQSRYQSELPVGEVQLSNQQLQEDLGDSFKKTNSRTTLLAAWAMQEATNLAQWENDPNIVSGLISATTVGGMDRTENYLKDIKSGGQPSIREVAMHDCGAHTAFLGKEYGINGFTSTISTACSSSANAIMLGAQLVLTGKLDRVIVGGVDALSLFTLNGFNALFILDATPCRPLDASRKGLNLGEGAAYLVLESAALAEGKKKYGKVVGWGNANDAFHQTANSPEGKGAYLAMQKALKQAQLLPEQIDYINMHGTGTENNDLTESRAVKALFEDVLPPLSSTKGFTGHTLGAAGAIEAVFSIMALQNQQVLPGLRFKTPIEATGLNPVKKMRAGNIKNVLSNSFGFGGNSSSLVFKS